MVCFGGRTTSRVARRRGRALMDRPDLSKLIDERLRVSRVILLALCAGVALFLGVAFVVRAQGAGRVPEVPVLSYVAAAFAVVVAGASLVVPGMATANWRRAQARRPAPQGPAEFAGNALTEYQTSLIIGAA